MERYKNTQTPTTPVTNIKGVKYDSTDVSRPLHLANLLENRLHSEELGRN